MNRRNFLSNSTGAMGMIAGAPSPRLMASHSASVDLHTAGGDPNTRNGLLRAAQRHSDIIISADNVIGDFNPFLPFHASLVEAAKTNPIAVHFDFNGEYWGRNFVPTSALNQYGAHIEEARHLGAVYL